MKRIIIIFCIILIPARLIAQTEAVILRLDYQSLEFKTAYYLDSGSTVPSGSASGEHYHGLIVNIVPAGDFGRIKIFNAFDTRLTYEASTIWDGTGHHVFPTDQYSYIPGDTNQITVSYEFFDIIDYFFSIKDYVYLETAWDIARTIPLPASFDLSLPIGVLAYLHYFSVGMQDPTTAEWVFIIYTIPEDPPNTRNSQWIDISNNLPQFGARHINAIQPHSFFGDSVWLGTDAGLYATTDGGDVWHQVDFDARPDVSVSCLAALPNPIVNCLCSMIAMGTDEPITGGTASPGRVFRSFIDGENWENLSAPDTAVTAVALHHWNPSIMVAGFYNENLNIGSPYRFNDKSGWHEIEFYGDETFDDPRINCITTNLADTNAIYLGTDKGLFYTNDYGINWTHTMESFDIVSIEIDHVGNEYIIYLATSGRSKSDGIYWSIDHGANWDVVHWRTDIITLERSPRELLHRPFTANKFYMVVADQGVFESYDGCRHFYSINQDLPEKELTCLGVHTSKAGQLYLGTVDGVYKYVPVAPKPDLMISNADLAYWPPNPQNGSLVEIFVTIHNRSDVDVYDVEVSVVDNADGLLTVIVPIDTAVIEHLSPNSASSIRIEWYPVHQKGDNLILVDVDPNNRIDESNESNNLASIPIHLSGISIIGNWIDISNNLRQPVVNDLAINPFDDEQLYIATDDGAFFRPVKDGEWQPLAFTDSTKIKITQIEAGFHPVLDWATPTILLGTGEYSDIPEDRHGSVYISEDGGLSWYNTDFPGNEVTALAAPWNAFLDVRAAGFNPFYYEDEFYIRHDSLWTECDITPDDIRAVRINCFDFEPLLSPYSFGPPLYLGTSDGLFVVHPDGHVMNHRLNGLNVVSVIVNNVDNNPIMMAATSGHTQWDGVYQSPDWGHTWVQIAGFMNIAMMVLKDYRLTPETMTHHLFIAVRNLGVFESINMARSWIDITQDLTDLDFTTLVVGEHDPRNLYVGTKSAIYSFEVEPTHIEGNASEEIMEENLQLLQNYPNPFNRETLISFQVPTEYLNKEAMIKIYNTLGQLVRSANLQIDNAGYQRYVWDGTNNNGTVVNTGVYICVVKIGEYSAQIRMIFLK